MATKQSQLNRREIVYFDGINLSVGSNLAKSQDLSMSENARSTEIGIIEKRQGYRRLGNDITATANFGLFYFDDSNTSSKAFYRVSTVSATTNIYYLNTSDNWTALAGNGTGLSAASCSFVQAEDCEFLVNGTDINRYINTSTSSTITYTSADLGGSTTQFDITNTTGSTYRYTYDGTGTDPSISANTMKVGDVVHIMAQNFAAANKGAFTLTGVGANYFEVTNTSGSAESNKTIGTGAIRINNHLTSSPIAYKINYYKDSLYLGDYTSTTRYQNGIIKSSKPLGIVALVDGDHDQPITTLKVTDLKYIKTNDVLDVYRGNTKIGIIIVTAKNSDTNTLTIDSFATNIKSADELWVGGTYTGKRVFRWMENPESGEDVKQYDTFKLSGGENDALTLFTNIGNIMIIGNKKNLAFWNDTSLTNLDLNIGCVSSQGWVKTFGTLFFLGYDGIYATDGTSTPKLITAKIQAIFDGATKANLETTAMGKKGYSIFASIGDVTLYNPDDSTDRTLSDVTIEYNIRQNTLFIHTGIDAHYFANYYTSTDIERLEYCAGSGNVFEFLYGNSENNSNEIYMRIDTQPITLSSEFENIVYPYKIIIETDIGSAIQCFVSLDYDDFYALQGEADKGCTILHVTPKDEGQIARCRVIQISLREFSKTPCKIKRIAILYSYNYEEELYKKQN